ncbi:SDR family NAD(P)-dependent oxidoreductase [Sedimentitalea nanhaiensis]|uniref:Short-chain dehydrogenase n=1 Tax=Sedimentitalea nanhaiensis TaxID=999627 RepID=A0A1I7DAE7_9RHOB|nr:SDR family NAD(P)-dependent oxidoreductase [Sedimentitalea nanhaiensis]SFU08649.1 Short-chain dehydrogenase [Sedimentitalea nanhaiensis]
MKTAVITGGAGGLGRALAQALQERGWCTVLLDLDVTGLAETNNQLPIDCDLTDGGQLDAAVEQIVRSRPSIDLVIYNAGVTSVAAFQDTFYATMRKLFEVNYFSATALTRALLHPVRAARGTHLAISSVAGFAPLYHRTAYAASKHALQGFFTSLRSEEAPHGVRCVIAAPSFVATNIGADRSAKGGLARPGSAGDAIGSMKPGEAAAHILRGLDRGATMIPVGRVAWMAWWINRLSPRLYRHLMERNIRKA